MELVEYILAQNIKFDYYILIKSNSNTNNIINLFKLFNIKSHPNDWKIIKTNNFTISDKNNCDFINLFQNIDKVSYKIIKNYTFKFKIIYDINSELYIFASIKNNNIIKTDIITCGHSIVFIKHIDRINVNVIDLAILYNNNNNNYYYYMQTYNYLNPLNKIIVLGHNKYNFIDFINLTSLEHSILHYCNTMCFINDKIDTTDLILKEEHIINFNNN